MWALIRLLIFLLLLLEIHKHLRPFFPTWAAHIFCVMVPLNSSSSQDYGLTIITCLGIFLFVMSEIVQHNEMFEIHIKFIHIYIFLFLYLYFFSLWFLRRLSFQKYLQLKIVEWNGNGRVIWDCIYKNIDFGNQPI